MNKKSIPILLIIMLLIAPIASAFDHCKGMNMSSHLLENQFFSLAQSVDDVNHSAHQKMLNKSKNKQKDSDCHTNSGCIVHACGGYGITSSMSAINTLRPSYPSIFVYAPPYSTFLASNFKPPISSL